LPLLAIKRDEIPEPVAEKRGHQGASDRDTVEGLTNGLHQPQ
jgi:hypothetical protein